MILINAFIKCWLLLFVLFSLSHHLKPFRAPLYISNFSLEVISFLLRNAPFLYKLPSSKDKFNTLSSDGLVDYLLSFWVWWVNLDKGFNRGASISSFTLCYWCFVYFFMLDIPKLFLSGIFLYFRSFYRLNEVIFSINSSGFTSWFYSFYSFYWFLRFEEL